MEGEGDTGGEGGMRRGRLQLDDVKHDGGVQHRRDELVFHPCSPSGVNQVQNGYPAESEEEVAKMKERSTSMASHSFIHFIHPLSTPLNHL
jgi:hypothetical protein